MEREVLPAEEVRKAIECRSPSRVPMMIHQWHSQFVHVGEEEQAGKMMSQYPMDGHYVCPRMPEVWDKCDDADHIPGYSWMNTPPPPDTGEVVGHDATVAIEDWSQLDGMLDAWPDPHVAEMFYGDGKKEVQAAANGRYSMILFAYCLYERLWSLRGMENVLCDFYTDPDKMHQLMDALTDFYCVIIERGGKELGVDAIYTTDDIGMQTGPMFSPEIFKEFFLPRYERMIATAHDNGMHFLLHTCGDVRLFLQDFVDIGLDVIHPIQRYTMDEREVAKMLDGRICVWAGMDVQQILPRGTPDDVRREVRFMIDTYDRADGGCMVTCGNGITADIPLANMEAFYDETYNYGLAHRR